MLRPPDKHLDNQELDALVSSRPEITHSSNHIRSAEEHVASCPECSDKVRQYSLLMDQRPRGTAKGAPAGADCPQDIDWDDVVNGLWPEHKASQLTMHAAMCDHCGPLLRTAAAIACDASPEEQSLLDKFRAPSRPRAQNRGWSFAFTPFMKWVTPVIAIMVIVGVAGTVRRFSPAKLSGDELSELAATLHAQNLRGNLALEVHSESQQALNQWLKGESPFPLELPVSPGAPGNDMAYLPDGARLVKVRGQKGAFIAYHAQPNPALADMQPEPVSLLVIPASVAVASGGVQANYPKVSFHYATLHGFRVVTWSQHGLTYALVSQESNSSQRSCMICHSAMRDRDLSHTPVPISQRYPVFPKL